MDVRIQRQVMTLLAGLAAFCVLLAGVTLARAEPAAKSAVQSIRPAQEKEATLAGPSAVVSAAMTKTLDRDIDPVIVAGTTVSGLLGTPADELFVYAYTGGAWTQIPAQVDEVAASGAYTVTEDGLLDANDEIVFMAKDLSDQAPAGTSVRSVLPVGRGWYEIEVTDPVSPTEKGWAYIVHSHTLTPTFAADYVGFDRALHRVNGTSYVLGFATPDSWADYLALSSSGVDILDRTKMRLLCEKTLDPRTWLCPINEEKTLPLQDNLIKDGPVRVIVRAGRVLAYGSMAVWTISLDIQPYLAGDVRFSIDFSPDTSGATYYNAVVPGGVTVDGITDTVPATPSSPWWQVSTGNGTLVQAQDTSTIGGVQSNYYVDNSDLDTSDTGDQQHYGDTGVYVQDPNLSFAYTFALYVLSGQQPNVGATYQAYFEQPLSASASTTDRHVYLPGVHKATNRLDGSIERGARRCGSR